jgi:hypothetical protein
MPQKGGLAVFRAKDMGLDSSCMIVLDHDVGGIVDLRGSRGLFLLLLLLLLLIVIGGGGGGRGGSSGGDRSVSVSVSFTV